MTRRSRPAATRTGTTSTPTSGRSRRRRRSRRRPPTQIARGRQVFTDGGCAKCHGGPGWTISRRYYVPTGATTTALTSSTFTAPGVLPADLDVRQPRPAADADLGPARDQQPPTRPAPRSRRRSPIAEAACATRNVGTFGILGDPALTDALEVRAGERCARARGRADRLQRAVAVRPRGRRAVPAPRPGGDAPRPVHRRAVGLPHQRRQREHQRRAAGRRASSTIWSRSCSRSTRARRRSPCRPIRPAAAASMRAR